MIQIIKNNIHVIATIVKKSEKMKVFALFSIILIACLFTINAKAVENTVDKINLAISVFKSKGTFVYDKDGDGNAEIIIDSSDLKTIEGKVNSNDSFLNDKISSVETSVTQKINNINSAIETKIQNINTTINNTISGKLSKAIVLDETKGDNGLVYDKTNDTYTLYLKTMDLEGGN